MKKIRTRITLFLIAFALVLATLIPASALPQPPSIAFNIRVYVSEDDKEYFHRSVCGRLYGKQITGIPLWKAYQEGYAPCGQCKPPQINEQ